jgi:hypothetical protein
MTSMLGPNNALAPGQSLMSGNGQYRLDMQHDGNLVLYRNSDGQALWASGTDGRAVSRVIMQDDGNFVIYGFPGPLWASGTDGQGGAFLIVQDDGNVVIYRPNAPVWATNTMQ